MHPANNGLRSFVEALDFINSVASVIIPSDLLADLVELGITAIQISVLICYDEHEAAISKLASYVDGIIQGEFVVDEIGVFSIISIVTSFDELINTLILNPPYCRDIINYTITHTGYNVTLELSSGVRCNLIDVDRVLTESNTF